jgi:glycosyltransferase involved in cell wall biosynthesis
LGVGERMYYISKSWAFLRRARPDAVLLGGWESPAYWQALLWCKTRRVRAVGFYESTRSTHRHTKGLIPWSRRLFFKLLDEVVVPGVAARDAVIAMGIDEAKIRVGFNAVDVEWISTVTCRLRAEAGTRRADEGHRFLYLGQLIERKNVASLIRAFSLIRQADDTLTIAGSGVLDDRLVELAGQLGVAERVHFAGLVPYVELPALFAGHDTLVLPSLEEVWGLVVNEALAAGLHAVISSACGVALSVEEMEGVHITETDVESIGWGMQASKAAWAGPIESPEILIQTPGRFASVFRDALQGV